MTASWMECYQPSNDKNVSAVRRQFLAWLAPLDVPEEVVEALSVALTEACTNAVQHGSPRGERDSFHVRCRLDERTLTVDVIDHGPGCRFRGVTCPDPLALEEYGRGIWLMSNLADRMQIRSETGGTHVHLEKDLRVAPAPIGPLPHENASATWQVPSTPFPTAAPR
jgi:serine/threonine-protein kinase RsbW